MSWMIVPTWRWVRAVRFWWTRWPAMAMRSPGCVRSRGCLPWSTHRHYDHRGGASQFEEMLVGQGDIGHAAMELARARQVRDGLIECDAVAARRRHGSETAPSACPGVRPRRVGGAHGRQRPRIEMRWASWGAPDGPRSPDGLALRPDAGTHLGPFRSNPSGHSTVSPDRYPKRRCGPASQPIRAVHLERVHGVSAGAHP